MPIIPYGPEDRALAPKEIGKILGGLSRAEIDRRQKSDPKFPKMFNIGPRRKAAMLSSCMSYLEKQAAAAEVGGADDDV